MTDKDKAKQMFLWRNRKRWRDDNDMLVKVINTTVGQSQLYYFRKLFSGEMVSPVINGVLYPAIVTFFHDGDVDSSYHKDGKRITPLPDGWDDMDEETKLFTFEMI